jgi:hypothetical protein
MFSGIFEDREERPMEIGPNGMSIDLLRAVYRNPSIPLPVRIRCAVACLPFELPKLSVSGIVEADGDIAAILDRRIKRLQEAKLIEHTQQVETKPILPRIADRRYRRI